MFPLRSLHMFGNAAHWKSQIQNFTSSGTKAAGGWTPGRGPGWRSSLARPLREGQVESEIRRAQRLESMRLQAPNVRIFALKSSRGQMGTYYSEAVSCPLHVSTAVSARVRNCCSLIGRAKFRISLGLEQKLPAGGPAEALDGGRALLGPFARVKWRVKPDEPKDW